MQVISLDDTANSRTVYLSSTLKTAYRHGTIDVPIRTRFYSEFRGHGHGPWAKRLRIAQSLQLYTYLFYAVDTFLTEAVLSYHITRTSSEYWF
jgi:hypothetical protein